MKSHLKKPLALLGSVVIGVLSALAVAAPAHAQTTVITATTDCADTGWSITWTLQNRDPDRWATIDKLETSVDSAITGELVEGATLPAADTPSLTGQQIVPSTTDSATLTVMVTWSDGESETIVGDTITKPSCHPTPEPDVEVLHTCVGLSITVTNPENGPEGEVFLAPSDGDSILIAILPGMSETVEFLAPPDVVDFSIEVTGSVTETIQWRKPDDCPPMSLDVVSNCQGLSFTVVNPRNADRASVRFTPTVGQAQTVTVDPGGSAQVGFSADGANFEVAVSSGDYTETFGWGTPADCQQLPTTGGSLTGWVASGAAAVLLGSGMIVLLQRRRRATW